MRSLRAVPYPATRLRRLRRTGALRGLARETDVVVSDLVMPLFVAADAWTNDGLPALGRHTVDGLLREVETLVEAGVPGVILFGVPHGEGRRGFGRLVGRRRRPRGAAGLSGRGFLSSCC